VSGTASLREADAAARARAQREFRAPLVLEAGAGTGKTATLVARILAWCLGPGWERAERAQPDAEADRVAARALSRVVAITFTETAAAEMATRVEEALAALSRGEPVRGLDEAALPEPALRAPRAAALRDAVEHLVVQTLHAYARRLLAAHPFDAALHPELVVDADGAAQRKLVRAVLDERLRELYAEDGDALALAAAGHGPGELEQELLALLENGVAARDLAGDPVASERIAACLARARDRLAAFASAARGRLSDTGRSRVGAETARLVDTALAAASAPGEPRDALAAVSAIAAGDERCVKRLAEWSKQGFNQDERRALGDHSQAVAAAAAELAPLLAHLASLDLDRLARAHRVLGALLADVEAALDRRGIATFASLLSRAAWLLESRPEVARAVRTGIDQLLVDEFQDTDPRQCAIAGAIALAGDPGERPGLFLVGDPKQSIYGWRDADLAAYEDFVARVRAEGGELHRLSVNHRSLPAVLAEVERVIAPVMRREAGVQPAFEPLVASDANALRSFDASERFAGVEHWMVAPWSAGSAELEPTLASDATRLEARALAADLLALRRERSVLWKSVGVLFRSRGDWDVYLSALREAGVPFSVEGDRSYYRRREIIDAAAWVRCLLDPDDTLALVSALRSAVVGVPDAAWVPLFARGLPERVAALSRPDPDALAALAGDVAAVAAALPADVPGISRIAGWERNLSAALHAIGALRESFASDPGDVFVEKLRAALLLEAGEAARFLGSWRVANLERFFRDLSEDLAAGADEQDVLRRLRHAVAEEEEMQEEPPHDRAADAVQILTLHGAKGLDFDHVYLMQLHKGAGDRRDRPRIDPARVDGALELRLLGVPSLFFDRVAARRAQVADAERVRLLYVGMTRARKRLVVSGAWPAFLQRKTAGMHSLLLEERLDLPGPTQLAALLADAARAGRSCVDVAGARFVVPALRPGDAAPEPERAGAAAGEATVAGADTGAIERRREAEARMARPFRGVASGGEGAGAADSFGGANAEVARLTGIAVHRAFERFDLALPAREAVSREIARLDLPASEPAPLASRSAALAAARRLLEGLAGGRLLARLDRIRRQVVARELPVLVPPGARDDAVGFVAGTLDLVYRDPDTDGLVVVDLKTDAVADDARALGDRAGRYARQGALYCRALREGLGLATEPRFELWFVAADRWIPADPPGPGGPRAPEQMSLSLS
jgi:ATP-dependent helicase/nuclease subunit A